MAKSVLFFAALACAATLVRALSEYTAVRYSDASASPAHVRVRRAAGAPPASRATSSWPPPSGGRESATRGSSVWLSSARRPHGLLTRAHSGARAWCPPYARPQAPWTASPPTAFSTTPPPTRACFLSRRWSATRRQATCARAALARRASRSWRRSRAMSGTRGCPARRTACPSSSRLRATTASPWHPTARVCLSSCPCAARRVTR